MAFPRLQPSTTIHHDIHKALNDMKAHVGEGSRAATHRWQATAAVPRRADPRRARASRRCLSSPTLASVRPERDREGTQGIVCQITNELRGWIHDALAIEARWGRGAHVGCHGIDGVAQSKLGALRNQECGAGATTDGRGQDQQRLVDRDVGTAVSGAKQAMSEEQEMDRGRRSPSKPSGDPQ